jgi:hypothetical protein
MTRRAVTAVAMSLRATLSALVVIAGVVALAAAPADAADRCFDVGGCTSGSRRRNISWSRLSRGIRSSLAALCASTALAMIGIGVLGATPAGAVGNPVWPGPSNCGTDGADASISVPVGTVYLNVTLNGGAGGAGGAGDSANGYGGAGGNGASLTTIIPVGPGDPVSVGDTLSAVTGCQGEAGAEGPGDVPPNLAYGGPGGAYAGGGLDGSGGSGGIGTYCFAESEDCSSSYGCPPPSIATCYYTPLSLDGNGGGGGGASALSDASTSTTLAVAGGGGGGGETMCAGTYGGAGGAGGGGNGANAGAPFLQNIDLGGAGGTSPWGPEGMGDDNDVQGYNQYVGGEEMYAYAVAGYSDGNQYYEGFGGSDSAAGGGGGGGYIGGYAGQGGFQAPYSGYDCAGGGGGGGGTNYVQASGYVVNASAPITGDGSISVTFDLADPPLLPNISQPASGQTYYQNEVVPTSFSCTDGEYGSGISTCTDSNGATGGSGDLYTASVSPGANTFSYTVTATSYDGLVTETSIEYTVIPGNPPRPPLIGPASGGTYTLGQSVPTVFSCPVGVGDLPITSCTDGISTSGRGLLDTSTLGFHFYTVIAWNSGGAYSTSSISYEVVPDPPTVSITSPTGTDEFALGQVVPTSFSCTEGAQGTGIASCVDSNGASGGSGFLDTSTVGTDFTYTVTATSLDGETATASFPYRVQPAAPTVTMNFAGLSGTCAVFEEGPGYEGCQYPYPSTPDYALGQVVPTTFSCTAALNDALSGCVDSNGGGGDFPGGSTTSYDGVGTLDTSTPGIHGYHVIAFTNDAAEAFAYVYYNVVAPPPTATINAPTSGGTYYVGENVPTSYSCTAGTDETISSCSDGGASSSQTSGLLDTSTPGTFTYTVTATEGDNYGSASQTGTASITYTVVALAAPPEDVTATSPTLQPVLNWSAVPTATSYNVYNDGTLIGSTTSTSFTDTTATEGTYSYYVTSVNAAGESSPGNTVIVMVGTQPSITSAASASTPMDQPFSFTVTTTGDPTPSLVESGPLPSGLSFTDNGDGTATIAGMAAAGTAGDYPITITASNGLGTPAAQSFDLTVTTATSAPTITSASSDIESFGVPFSFTVTTTGYPVPALTKSGALPAGITFTDNGDGTATIAGDSPVRIRGPAAAISSPALGMGRI